jgi:hypothetical protein
MAKAVAMTSPLSASQLIAIRQSAGTRTVKLRGRAKKITFHVFDPCRVEEVLNEDLVSTWREEDAATAAENRRRAASQRKLVRAEKGSAKTMAVPDSSPEDGTRHKLKAGRVRAQQLR